MYYNQTELLRLAKRYQNAKRSYLFVNPLQAKHLAVAPFEAMSMMQQLGSKVYHNHPETDLIIGFAETATAIALHAAMCFPEAVRFLHTTREVLDSEYLAFQEEHSHAVEQKICLPKDIQSAKIMFIDDEISTGKTLRNIILQIRQELSGCQNAEFVAASILNRISDENKALLSQEGISCEMLCKLDDLDYAQQTESFVVTAPEAIQIKQKQDYKILSLEHKIPDSRKLHTVGEYKQAYQKLSQECADRILPFLIGTKQIVILGTEECMYPALFMGHVLEHQGFVVRCHATTRSPIGICRDKKYPMQEGYALPSFYDSHRTVYIYNIYHHADAVLVVTDSKSDTEPAMQSLMQLFPSATLKILVKG